MKISSKKKWHELTFVAILAAITHLLFWNGQLDLSMARFFYRPDSIGELWPLQKFWLWQWFYNVGNLSTLVVSSVLALLLILQSWIKKTSYSIRLKSFYVILVITLAPGILVNMVLKEHWGRPRPREVIEFQGQFNYQPPLVVSNTGKHSFVCGHCSVSYSLFAFYFILRKRNMFALFFSLGYGILMGIARMSAGGHFASDVLWSGYITFLVCWFLYYYVFKEFRYGYQHALETPIEEGLTLLLPHPNFTLPANIPNKNIG
jgi:lipid A 4'-phosphatase